MCVCQAVVLLLVDLYNHNPQQHQLEKTNISISVAVSFTERFGSHQQCWAVSWLALKLLCN